MRIAVDAMGGDHAPGAIVEGAVAAARDLGLSILLVGDRTRVEVELGRHETAGLDIEMRHAAEEVGMDDAPTEALRKSDSSLVVGLAAVRDGDAGGFVFAGNTGAGMVAGAHVLGRIHGVERPAIAVQVPNLSGDTVLLDAGANVDSRGVHLVQFALMGEAYVRTLRHMAAPRIGLLCNGTESGKGSAAVREAAPILARLPINYVGLVEGNALTTGDVDVVVCDGFVGNLVLKSLEGFGGLVGTRLSEALERGFWARLAGLLLRRRLRSLARELDPGETGGALLLGLDGPVIKAHGSSDARAIRNAIGVAAELALAEVTVEVAQSIASRLEMVAKDAQLVLDDGPKPGRARRIWHAIRKRLWAAEAVGRDAGTGSGEAAGQDLSAGPGEAAGLPAPEPRPANPELHDVPGDPSRADPKAVARPAAKTDAAPVVSPGGPPAPSAPAEEESRDPGPTPAAAATAPAEPVPPDPVSSEEGPTAAASDDPPSADRGGSSRSGVAPEKP